MLRLRSSRLFARASFRVILISIAAVGTFLAAYLLTNPMTSESAQLAPASIRGVVAGSHFTLPSGSLPSSTIVSYYQGAKVCVDANNDSVCDVGEATAITDTQGQFVLTSLNIGPIVAEIPTTAINAGYPVTARMVFRASLEQVAEGASSGSYVVAVTPLSTEAVRMIEVNGLSYQAAKQNLATRLIVPTEQVLSDPHSVTDNSIQTAILKESVILSNRFALAAKMVDRHDVAPAALAVNPNATGPAITIKEAHQAAMNLERIPRYDHIFIIMLENKATSSIKNSVFAPKINAYLNNNNQFTSYYATGNPSEPNYTALAVGDDFGIVDDSAWNCVPSGDTADAAEDPLPPGMGACTNATNHNIKNKPNLFNSLSAGGMNWRIYNESTNPGRDVRQNGVAVASLTAPDHVYPAGSPVGAIGNPNLILPFPSGLYATKHNPPMALQNARSAAEFFASNRTMGGGQWDDAIRNSLNTPAGWDLDQFGTDLASGDIGNLNFLVPDQCDDMHGVTVTGRVPPSTTQITASDCGGSANIYRGDLYVDYLIKKIQASSVWTNTQRRSAIVIMFDEGTATSGFNSCCGWNPSAGSSIAGKALGPLVKNPEGTVTVESVARYNQGNKGHGTSIFGVLTNQPNAPKGVVDSDAYSHMSFGRTLEDMFQLADPADDWSYMGRAKYTEKFIAANILNLPEYASSADRHFDAVRPMNHAYVIPPGYVQKNGFPTAQIGPDANQLNAWALGLTACGTTVSDRVTVTRSGLRLNVSTQRYVQTVTLRNAGTDPIAGPISLVLDGVSSNASLFNRAGLTSCGTATPSPYINAGLGTNPVLAPGQSVIITLEFTNPANQGITYTTRVLAGSTTY